MRVLLEMADGPIYFRTLFTVDEVDSEFITEVTRRTIRAFRDPDRDESPLP